MLVKLIKHHMWCELLASKVWFRQLTWTASVWEELRTGHPILLLNPGHLSYAVDFSITDILKKSLCFTKWGLFAFPFKDGSQTNRFQPLCLILAFKNPIQLYDGQN
jgi:hypothetical protein